MSNVSSHGEHRLSLARRINAVCDRFERAWQAGPRPCLEDFLGDTPEPERLALLRELIALDIDYRRRAGENPTAEEYRERFPALEPPVAVSTVIESPGSLDGPPDPDPLPIGAAPTGRYQLGDEIGHGGMGTVIQGHDPDLGREVAIKVLLPAHQDQPEMVQRFLDEARVGGQLQHPGVVPVHERGTFPDGRPYFTMKLVQGRTLAALLKERPDPAHDLPRFLKVFEQVCQTLAYAHSRGVIHRDLKPHNIMVGSFGEVWVMDWGLAKVLGPVGPERPEESGRGIVNTARGPGEARLSRTGQAMGTPAYMAPEQARGEIDQVDERADVFGLGAILCEILTGKAPYSGLVILDLARQANLGDAFVRLGLCTADAELVRLARECLQPHREDRPRDARALADRVTGYLVGVQERLRQAELQRAAAEAREGEAQARAEAEVQARQAERRAGRRTKALAAALFGLVLLGAGGWLWIGRDRQARYVRTTEGVNQALDKAEELSGQARKMFLDDPARAEAALAQWKHSLAALEKAEEVYSTGLADEATRLRLEAARLRIDALGKELEQGKKDADKDLPMAMRLAEIRLGKTDKGKLGIRRTADEYEAAFVEYGEEMVSQKGMRAAVRVGDQVKQGRLTVDEVHQLEEDKAAARLGQRAIKEQLVFALDDWAMSEEPTVAARLLRIASLVDRDPWRNQVRQAVLKKDQQALRDLAGSGKAAAQPAVSLTLLAQALMRSGQKADDAAAVALLRQGQRSYPGDLWINYQLATVLFFRAPPKLDESIRFYTAAVVLRPQSPTAHHSLGYALAKKGELDQAIASYQEALRLKKELPLTHFDLGQALEKKGQLDQAIASYQEALRLGYPCDDILRDVLARKIQRGDGIADFEQAARLKPDDVVSHYSLGVALEEQKKWVEAEAAYRKAAALRPYLTYPHSALGLVLLQQEKFAEAEKAFRWALRSDDFYAHYNLGRLQARQGKFAEAEASFRKAVDLKPDDFNARYDLGRVLYSQKKVAAAAVFRKAIALKPGDARAHYSLGLVYLNENYLRGAVDSLRKAVELKSDFAESHYNLGDALAKMGDLDGAIAAYQKGLSLKKDDAETHFRLGNALLTKGDLDGAAAAFEEAIGLKKDFIEAYFTLGLARLRTGEFSEALVALKRGRELGSGDPQWYDRFKRLLSDCVQLVKLDKRLPGILSGKDQPDNPTERLEFALLCQYKRLYATSARFFEGGFAANPNLADDPTYEDRYNAACSAALAGCGEGEDSVRTDARERTRWRMQALNWLQDDLKMWSKHLESDKPEARSRVRNMLQRWQYNLQLAGLRNEKALAKLPEAEQQACRRLWADVAALLKRTAEQK
jgi:serine/threonine-protein kinase